MFYNHGSWDFLGFGLSWKISYYFLDVSYFLHVIRVRAFKSGIHLQNNQWHLVFEDGIHNASGQFS